MQASVFSLIEVRMILKALDHLAAELKGGKEDAGKVQQALSEIKGLKAKLEAGDYCEAGAEEICASTRYGTFW